MIEEKFLPSAPDEWDDIQFEVTRAIYEGATDSEVASLLRELDIRTLVCSRYKDQFVPLHARWYRLGGPRVRAALLVNVSQYCRQAMGSYQLADRALQMIFFFETCYIPVWSMSSSPKSSHEKLNADIVGFIVHVANQALRWGTGKEIDLSPQCERFYAREAVLSGNYRDIFLRISKGSGWAEASQHFLDGLRDAEKVLLDRLFKGGRYRDDQCTFDLWVEAAAFNSVLMAD